MAFPLNLCPACKRIGLELKDLLVPDGKEWHRLYEATCIFCSYYRSEFSNTKLIVEISRDFLEGVGRQKQASTKHNYSRPGEIEVRIQLIYQRSIGELYKATGRKGLVRVGQKVGIAQPWRWAKWQEALLLERQGVGGGKVHPEGKNPGTSADSTKNKYKKIKKEGEKMSKNEKNPNPDFLSQIKTKPIKNGMKTR